MDGRGGPEHLNQSAAPGPRRSLPPRSGSGGAPLLDVQRAVGNAALARWLGRSPSSVAARTRLLLRFPVRSRLVRGKEEGAPEPAGAGAKGKGKEKAKEPAPQFVEGRALLEILDQEAERHQGGPHPATSVMGQFMAIDEPRDQEVHQVQVAGNPIEVKPGWWTGPADPERKAGLSGVRNQALSYPQFADAIRGLRDRRVSARHAGPPAGAAAGAAAAAAGPAAASSSNPEREVEQEMVREMRQALLRGSEADQVEPEIAEFVAAAGGTEARRNPRAHAEFLMFLDLLESGKVSFDDGFGPGHAREREEVQGKAAVAKFLGIEAPQQMLATAIDKHVKELDVAESEKKKLRSYKVGVGRWGGLLPVIGAGSATPEVVNPAKEKKHRQAAQRGAGASSSSMAAPEEGTAAAAAAPAAVAAERAGLPKDFSLTMLKEASLLVSWFEQRLAIAPPAEVEAFWDERRRERIARRYIRQLLRPAAGAGAAPQPAGAPAIGPDAAQPEAQAAAAGPVQPAAAEGAAGEPVLGQ